jgi:ribosomal protein S18 acetylase RimI-like enzyme
MNNLDRLIKLKDVLNKDYDFCHDLAQQNMEELVKKHWDSWNSELYKKSFDIKNTKIIIFGNEKVGFIRTEMKNNIFFIKDLQIIQRMKGKGIGKKVIELIEKEHKLIQLLVFKDNPAYIFYKKLGYKVKEEKEKTYLMEKIK